MFFNNIIFILLFSPLVPQIFVKNLSSTFISLKRDLIQKFLIESSTFHKIIFLC